MKFSYADFKKSIPGLAWPINELADKLSAIGHEAEVENDNILNVTLTSNRKDCQDLRYLAFDLAGVYNVKTVPNLISFETGAEIYITIDDVNKLLGANLNEADMAGLTRLGFKVNNISVTPPAFRDIATIADVAEEVFRLVGVEKLNITPLSSQPAIASPDFEYSLAIKTALVTAGLTETATSSFSGHGHVKLKNPFSEDEPYLRESLQDGLLRTLARNPYLKRVAFFEIGSVFNPDENEVLGIIIAGYKNSDELIKTINHSLGETVEFDVIDPVKCQKLGAKQGRVQWAELPLTALKPVKNADATSLTQALPKFQPISKFPPLVRDITVSDQPQKQIDTFRQNQPALLLAEPIDRYQDNVTYRLIFQKMDNSFDETDIRQIDDAINKHFFSH